MRRRSRTRRILKWVGLVACLAVAVLKVSSLFYFVGWHARSNDLHHVYLVQTEYLAVKVSVDVNKEPIQRRYATGGFVCAGPMGWVPEQFHWWPRVDVVDRWNDPTVQYRHSALCIPLWMPLLPLAICTGILWYRDRRPPRGHCQRCGYDLAGNESGVCPECGEVVKGTG